MADRSVPLYRRLAVIAAGMAVGVALSHGLVGCMAEDPTVSRVIDVIAGRELTLSEEGERQLERFRKAYDQYATSQDAIQLEHFRDAFMRVRASYVRPVSDTDLVDAAIGGMTDIATTPETPPEGAESAVKDTALPEQASPDEVPEPMTESHAENRTEDKPRVPPHPVEPAKLVEAALDAMMDSLDPHSHYLNPDEYNEMAVSTRGEFGGLGVVVSMEDGQLTVVSPIEDTPAAKAGLKAKDIITHLDGVPVKSTDFLESVKRMRGAPGTKIRLTIKRPKCCEFDVTLVRAIIEVNPVRWHVEGDVGHVRVSSFNEKTTESVLLAMDGLRAQLGPNLKGVVLDLRSNPGGLLDQAVLLSDAFLERGRIVSVRGRDPKRNRYYEAQAGDIASTLQMVTLIDGGSASASEIVAGALQDNGRALIMGTRSFGKGSVQTIVPLPLEGALKLTTQLYYAPSDRTIQAQGVAPDIILLDARDTEPDKDGEPAERMREADLPNALPALSKVARPDAAVVDDAVCPALGEEKDDRQLGCAVAVLRAGSRDAFLALMGNARRPSL